MERVTVARPSPKVKPVAKPPVKPGTTEPADKAVTPIHNTNVRTIQILGVAITGNLADPQKANVSIAIIRIRRRIKRLAKPAVGNGR